MNRDEFSNSYGQPVDWLVGTAKRNPEAFLVLAAGAALLLRSGGARAPLAPDSPHAGVGSRQRPQRRGEGG